MHKIMKKLLLLAVSSTLALPTLAQTEQGSKLIGVSVGGLAYRTDKKNNNFSATLYPSMGVFVANNLLVGSNVLLGYQRLRFETSFADQTSRSFSYGLTPFARYYVPGTGRHRFFGQLSAGVHWNSYRSRKESVNQPIETSRQTIRSFTYGGALGYNYFLSQNAALEVTAGYNRYSQKPGNGSYGDLDIQAGFSIFLPSKKAAASGN
ncbi:autotransporter outer membrane beta-barrel domain-containing protein [Hymenobacter weizhouensis]|uniref:autotransporter outer membrane beta-barrel domain-containing protein n=1 Tax=Hymenobacter sp. YIM 151500-1 TaxID=2987689 RepID=UPI002225D117|nr:autotransporter outer membrane beta-barrel domain-containing protein [Hymenobacter sp. YIM 151500-1]UYZ61993.1 autotransporter outer membrane beta-barrel domain-containing protein [Hymenobacter sp. YIM 151500-1]